MRHGKLASSSGRTSRVGLCGARKRDRTLKGNLSSHGRLLRIRGADEMLKGGCLATSAAAVVFRWTSSVSLIVLLDATTWLIVRNTRRSMPGWDLRMVFSFPSSGEGNQHCYKYQYLLLKISSHSWAYSSCIKEESSGGFIMASLVSAFSSA